MLITIIEMHVEEEITNNHGRLKRFVPEPESQDKVCIVFLILLFLYVLQKCHLEPKEDVWNVEGA